MIRSSVVCLLLSCVNCLFCGKDFVTLGRHQWRCKQKVNENVHYGSASQKGMPVEPVITSPTSAIHKSGVKCCGKMSTRQVHRLIEMSYSDCDKSFLH